MTDSNELFSLPVGKYKGFTIAQWLPGLVEEFYSLSERHPKTGHP